MADKSDGEILQSCGTEKCLIDRLEKTITTQSESQTNFIEKLLKVQIGYLSEQIIDLKKTLKEDTDDLFRRMRECESCMRSLNVEIGDKGFDKGVRAIITEEVGALGFTREVKAIVADNVQVKWIENYRKWLAFILASLTVIFLGGFVGWLLYLFELHHTPLPGYELTPVQQQQYQKIPK